MLEIVFLGTGSGVPSPRRNHASIWLSYEGEALLWDCGEGTQRQLISAKLNFMKIKRIFISHWHADHWAGLIGLMQTMNLEQRKEPLFIHAPEAERFVKDLLDLDYWGVGFRVIPQNVPYEGSKITPVYKTRDFEVLSIPAKHTVPAVAYCFKERDSWNVDIKKAGKYGLKQGPLIGRLKKKGEIIHKGKAVNLGDVGYLRKGIKVVYSGDTQPCSNLITLSKDADILIHDATFEAGRENRMHTGAEEAAKVARKARVGKLVLTHFSRRYQDVSPLIKEAKKSFKNTVAAKDFLRLGLKPKRSK